MKYGIILNIGTLDELGEMAELAESVGWDGVFYWDAVHIENFGNMFDPWVAMTVMALRTSKVTIGGIVMAVPRHRPWLFSRAAVSVDHASHGRLVLPVGLGALDDGAFPKVGEPTSARERAERLDESLAIFEGLWTGEPFAFEGKHYRMESMAFEPRPVQRPRIPIWVVGAWPREKSMQRVLRFDGILPNKLDDDGKQQPITPEDVALIRDYVRERRGSLDGFDIVVEGQTPGTDPAAGDAIVRPWIDAGATWWTEADWRQPVEKLRARIAAGPPRIRS